MAKKLKAKKKPVRKQAKKGKRAKSSNAAVKHANTHPAHNTALGMTMGMGFGGLIK